MNILDWINVGKISAERDENLIHYFYDNGTLASVIDNKKSFLLLGRKGAGKTALFRYLTENPREFIGEKDSIVSISLDDYSWNVHSLLSQNAAADSLAYRQSWKFIFLVEAINSLCKNHDSPKQIQQAKKTLEKIFGCPIPTIFDLVKNKILNLSKLTLPKGGLDLEGGDLDSLEITGGEVEFNEVSTNADLRSSLLYNIEGLTKYLETAIEAAKPSEGTVFLCFDRVDEAWDTTSRLVSEKVITGLVAAADSITEKHKGVVRPIIFIREDIFETLPLNDKNKLREDCGSLLKWDKDGLTKMLLKRINHYAKSVNLEIQDIDNLFDKSEMRQRLKPTGYILKRTMFRPRDFVSFMSKVISTLKEEDSDPFDEVKHIREKLTVEAIYSAEPQYSEWLQKELIDEWGVQLPYIKGYFDAFQNAGTNIINKIEIQTQLQRAGINADTPAELNEHLRFLFNNSIIGFKLGDQNYWRYKCFYSTQGFSDETEYRVHDGLFKALNLTEARNPSNQT